MERRAPCKYIVCPYKHLRPVELGQDVFFSEFGHVAYRIQGGYSRGFCLDTLHGCSNTLHGYPDRMQVDFSMFSHLYLESYTPFSSPRFFRSNDARDNLVKLLTLRTDSATKKISVVRAVYLHHSGSIFAAKSFVT